jgi:F0F1-type ATP synthase assembly protein I
MELQEKYSKLTEEQKQQLSKNSRKRGMIMGLKLAAVFFFANMFLVFINALFVQSSAFGLVGGMLTGFMMFSLFKNFATTERDRVIADIDKFLNN